MLLVPREGGSAQLEEGHLHHMADSVQPILLDLPHPQPVNPAREHAVMEGEVERKEGSLKSVLGRET